MRTAIEGYRGCEDDVSRILQGVRVMIESESRQIGKALIFPLSQNATICGSPRRRFGANTRTSDTISEQCPLGISYNTQVRPRVASANMKQSTPSLDSSGSGESNALGIDVLDVDADLPASVDELRQAIDLQGASSDTAEAQVTLDTTAPDSPGPLGSRGSSEALSRTPSVTESTVAAVTPPEENIDSQGDDGSEVSDILLPDGSNRDTSPEDPDSQVIQVPECGTLEISDGFTILTQSTSDTTAVILDGETPGLAKRIYSFLKALLIVWILLLSLCYIRDILPFPTQPVVDRSVEHTCHVTKMPLRTVNRMLHRVSNAVVGQGQESSGERLATGFAQTYKDDGDSAVCQTSFSTIAILNARDCLLIISQ